MKEEIKQIWIDALTSGEYWQTTEQLKRGTGYCCLGVLCDLYNKETGVGKWEGNIFYIGELHDDISLPKEVMRWAGINSPEANFNRTALSTENDRGKSFMEIAEIIFENF